MEQMSSLKEMKLSVDDESPTKEVSGGCVNGMFRR